MTSADRLIDKIRSIIHAGEFESTMVADIDRAIAEYDGSPRPRMPLADLKKDPRRYGFEISSTGIYVRALEGESYVPVDLIQLDTASLRRFLETLDEAGLRRLVLQILRHDRKVAYW